MLLNQLKCTNCGGSDFKSHKELKDFIVCSYCGTQYTQKVKDIISELPIDLKVTIKSNMSNMKINNSIIKGHMNNITGNYNIIYGNMNNIKGIGNIVEGDMNNNKEY